MKRSDHDDVPDSDPDQAACANATDYLDRPVRVPDDSRRAEARRRRRIDHDRADGQIKAIDQLTKTGATRKGAYNRGRDLAGRVVYTKGVIRRERDHEVFYVMISAKRQEFL